ncbi:alpha/beta hydrolase [Pseudoalteromonas distincta]|uniref:Alpha/beta hydrolase n=1 Tax=Pseudoalteromonas distincta TaxID=77608 RepID=A0ABT9GDA4_9GAMM|nr:MULTISPECIES: alpha/beta family hydrolase [Pseudoalteromonas distincta group]KAA1158929.1 alpha/beta hydrolase [Pseudoalteromonas distincta]KHM50813.1 alpha/beta hydrolase [Pseudoalteromonas elyakovii]KID35089.1 alpha/beta hydrolase [Pseudoalteromonas distincta]MDP4483860.1 alpha/beta hydrolase [Pseudoalteromonas elyakovii]
MIEWFKSMEQPAIAQFIFAHGAGAGSDSDFMQHMAKLISEQGVDVGLFDFEYMQIAKQTNKRRPPERAQKLLIYYERVLTNAQPDLPLFIGGKSMGGRMASMLACSSEQSLSGVIAFGYPFHPPGKPEKLRTDHFADIVCPFLVLQGERDTFGTREELLTMKMPKQPLFTWLSDGDHSLKPRKKSGVTELQNRETAALSAVEFIKQQIEMR